MQDTLRTPSGSSRPAPAAELARVRGLSDRSPVCLSAGEVAMLEAFELTRHNPGELAHILAGVRAGLYATALERGRRTTPEGVGRIAA